MEDKKTGMIQITMNFGENDVTPFVLREGSSDGSVLHQIFVQKDYDLGRLARFGDIRAQYQCIISSGRTPLIVDCGANIGASPIWFSRFFPEAKVFALEPEQHNFELLCTNCLFHYPNVSCKNAAISCVDETVYVQDPGQGNWAFRTSQESNSSGTRVQAVSIESVEKLFPESELFLVKIDIEGGESRLFESNLGWVGRAMVIVIELHDWMLPGSANSRNFLKAMSEHCRDFVFLGENVFSIRNDR
jgi:FkbM family methyltransferase